MIDKKLLDRQARTEVFNHWDEAVNAKTIIDANFTKEFAIQCYKNAYEACEEKLLIKFDRSFESLYKISMAMADNCIGSKSMAKRFDKLKEEYDELVEAFQFVELLERGISKAEHDMLIGEISDVLFVLLHIAHLSGGETPFSLLHKAMTKMLDRMNDSDYIAKN